MPEDDEKFRPKGWSPPKSRTKSISSAFTGSGADPIIMSDL